MGKQDSHRIFKMAPWRLKILKGKGDRGTILLWYTKKATASPAWHPHQNVGVFSSLLSHSDTKSCPALCDPMDFSMPGSSVLHCLPELAQILVCSSWWCYLTIYSSPAPFSFSPQSFPASGSFPVSWLFASDDQSIGVPASASVLPMNIQCYWGAVHIQTHPIPPSNVT